MSYPFVPSYHDYGPRNAVIKPLTIVVHMAEGGGTVGYLSRKNPNSVSVHYVVEYGGRVVQMLHESHVNGSLNPRDIRTTDDPPYTFRGETIRYGDTAARACLGEWWDDPNRATIGIEVEGFAKDGPNAVQAGALATLVRDIRKRQPGAPVLAHRDFADYKACPGKRVDWGSLGGHAKTGQEETVVDFYTLGSADGTVTVAVGRGVVSLVDLTATVPPADGRTLRATARVALREPFGGTGGEERQKGYLANFNKEAHIVLDETVERYEPADSGDPAPLPHSHNVSVDVDGQKVEGSVTFA